MSNPCADCPIDVDSPYCQYQCRNQKHKEELSKKPVLNFGITTTVAPLRCPSVKGSEDMDFNK